MPSIEELASSLDQSQASPTVAVNKTQKPSREDRIIENNSKILADHGTKKKGKQDSQDTVLPKNTAANKGMYSYEPNQERKEIISTIPDKTFSDFIHKFGNQLLEPDSLPPNCRVQP